MNLKSLARDTAVYGLVSIVGRFLNYLLVILYTYKIPVESGGYGIVTNLYAYTALFFALLTFGMETTLFRFANKPGADEKMVCSNALRMVGVVGIVFLAAVFLLLRPISEAMGYEAHPEYIGIFALITAQDAFQAVMFSRLRQQRRALRFVALKFAFIIPSILLNLFVFLVMDKIPALHDTFVRFDYGVGLIFFINLFCTTLVSFLFIPEMREITYGFDKDLAKQMLKYSWPLLLLSLVGVLNQVADKILVPYLMRGEEGMVQLGIYGACVKIAMIMSLLTQAFRYAYEPIVFADNKDRNSPATMAEIFMGVYFNLSFWYKLTDQNWWGAIISAIGVAVMVAINVIFVPKIGYWACAWGGFAGYGISMLLSYLIGQKKYPIHYDLRGIGLAVLVAGGVYVAHAAIVRAGAGPVLSILLGCLLILCYGAVMFLYLRRVRQ